MRHGRWRVAARSRTFGAVRAGTPATPPPVVGGGAAAGGVVPGDDALAALGQAVDRPSSDIA